MLSNSCEAVSFCFLIHLSTTLTKQAARKSKTLRELTNTEKLGMFYHFETDLTKPFLSELTVYPVFFFFLRAYDWKHTPYFTMV